LNLSLKVVLPAVARELEARFALSGKGLWLVGGWVRDALLGNVHSDLDFATDAHPQESAEIMRGWGNSKIWTTGIEFGTVGIKKGPITIEVTTFRSEVYREESRNPEVRFADSLETDLSRRDFTVNAMAIRLPDGQVVDPFGGARDLVARLIKTPLAPEISFSDDPLRMLRALRFASVLGFEVDPAVAGAIHEMSDRLGIVSKERVRDEFSKLMLGTFPSKALALADSTGLASEFLPELPALKLEQDPIHRHKDVFGHTLAVLENVLAAEQGPPDLELRLAALMHDVGKPKTKQITPKGVTFHHHEVVGADLTENRLKELRYPAKTVEAVRELVYLHLRFHTYRLGWTDKAVRRYVRDAGALLGKLNTLVRADCTTRNPAKARQLSQRMDDLEERIAELASREELMQMRPALNGQQVMAHLGIEPGKLVGEALAMLMEVRMESGEISEGQAYAKLEEWARGKAVV